MTHKEKRIYLYGAEKYWGNLKYDDALRIKNMLATLQLNLELSIPKERRDFSRITDIKEAISFNDKMINE